jgi:hypothetical protein
VLSNAGDHTPVIPFVEVVGKAAKTSPEQISAMAAKVGRDEFTILNVTSLKQFPTVARIMTLPVEVGV